MKKSRRMRRFHGLSPVAAAKVEGTRRVFGEKYGDTVRVLQIGGAPHALDGYSMELCGGTHVRSTGEIGPFRIVKEEAIAAGTRRVEAVAGDAVGYGRIKKWCDRKRSLIRSRERNQTLRRCRVSKMMQRQPKCSTRSTHTGAHLEKVDADVREWEKKPRKLRRQTSRARLPKSPTI